jgi:hypothetical protein
VRDGRYGFERSEAGGKCQGRHVIDCDTDYEILMCSGPDHETATTMCYPGFPYGGQCFAEMHATWDSNHGGPPNRGAIIHAAK